MKRLITLFFFYVSRLILSLRYRVKVKGLENLNSKNLSKAGGVLFLPNHSSFFVDPSLVTMIPYGKYPIRPMIVEYMYYTPIIHQVMKFINALPIPKFSISSNSLKKRKSEQVIQTVIKELKDGNNFLIYPGGKVKLTNKEIIGGASAVHRIINAVPEVNIVLVRTTGLWGSKFSYALTDNPPTMFSIIWWGIKVGLKNLIFFTPRRDVTIEFVPAGPDFPYQASRIDLNRYLENWYNKSEGVADPSNPYPGESLKLVSYSVWKEDLPVVEKQKIDLVDIELSQVPIAVQSKVLEKLAEMAGVPKEQINPEMSLASDLGLDSLDIAELSAFLSDEFDMAGIPVNELTTVRRVMAIAAQKIILQAPVEEEIKDFSEWKKSRPRQKAVIPAGDTIIEAFLNTCLEMGNKPMCADLRSGIITYRQAKMRVILLAEYIRYLPGNYVGVLLPASVAAYIAILACHLAGKVPMPINWTVGPRHLETVASLSKVEAVISAWSFLDRLENVDLDGIEDKIIMLEDMRREFSIWGKALAFFRSLLPNKKLLKLFSADKLTKDSQAVLLFTSGTESMPKGVPLTHENILSNQRNALKMFEVYTDDILIGILPPFHAFGFTVSGFLPLLAKIRAAYSPNPTDGKVLAKEIHRWGGTILCGAPSFLKNILKSGMQDQLKTLLLCVTGAEKAPPELFLMMKQKIPSARLVEGYGITECAPILTVNMSGNTESGVGEPLPNVELCIVDLETHQPKAKGQQGLILARGPNVFTGYLNYGINSPFIHVNGLPWYNTGDLGYLDEEGNLILAGRLKRFIKIGAEMISLGAIEEALLQMAAKLGHAEGFDGPIIAVCAREQAGEKPKIIVVSKFPITVDEVNKSLKDFGFSNLVKVSRVEVLPEIPLLGSGKVNYRDLETKYLSV